MASRHLVCPKWEFKAILNRSHWREVMAKQGLVPLGFRDCSLGSLNPKCYTFSISDWGRGPCNGQLIFWTYTGDLRWTPHPVIVAIRDNKEFIRVLSYSSYGYYQVGGPPNGSRQIRPGKRGRLQGITMAMSVVRNVARHTDILQQPNNIGQHYTAPPI